MNVCREDAIAYFESNLVPRPINKTVCISITQPGFPAPLGPFWAIGRFEFADWDVDRYPHMPNGNGNPALSRVFTIQDAADIRAFAMLHRGANFLVHCDAGVSRSAAVAEVLLEAFPEYADEGGQRSPNNYVRRLLRREFGLIPIGASKDE